MGSMVSTFCKSTNKFQNQISSSLAVGLATLVINSHALALTPVDLKDDRNAKSAGFDIIYEARDLDLPQNVREGFTQSRSSLDETKNRVVELKKCIADEALPFIKKAYWTKAKESLRLRVGTLRFDINTLVDSKPRSEKKAALAAKRQFFNDIENVDFAIRKKNVDAALKAYEISMKSLDVVLASVL